MSFEFALIAPQRIQLPTDLREPLEDPNDVEYLAMVGSDLLAKAGYRFILGGFGRARWNLDTAYDMSTFVEGLPGLLRGLKSEGHGAVDLYSQGVECSLDFSRDAGTVRIGLTSRTAWVPNPKFEICDFDYLDRMLKDFAIQFASGLQAISSAIAALPPFSSWRSGDIWGQG